MKKILIALLALSANLSAQTFDFSCDSTDPLFSEQYEGAWQRTQSRYINDGAWSAWRENTARILYAFSPEELYFAYGSISNVNSCRSKLTQIRGNEYWVVEEHLDTLKLISYLNGDPLQGIDYATKWYGISDEEIGRSWDFDGDGEYTTEQRYIRTVENVVECSENEDEIINLKYDVEDLLQKLICSDNEQWTPEFDIIDNSTMYALTEGGYDMLITDLNALILNITPLVSNNTTDTLMFELSYPNDTTLRVTGTYSFQECEPSANWNRRIFADNTEINGWSNLNETIEGDVVSFNFDLYNLPLFDSITVMHEDHAGNVASHTVTPVTEEPIVAASYEPLTGMEILPEYGLIIIQDAPGQMVSIGSYHTGGSTFSFYTSTSNGNSGRFYETRNIVHSNGVANGYKYYYVNNFGHGHDVTVNGTKYRTQAEAGDVIYVDDDFSNVIFRFPSKSTINQIWDDEIPFDFYNFMRDSDLEYRMDVLMRFDGIKWIGEDGVAGAAPSEYLRVTTGYYAKTIQNLSWDEMQYYNFGQFEHGALRVGFSNSADLVGAVQEYPNLQRRDRPNYINHNGDPIMPDLFLPSHGLVTFTKTATNTVEFSYDTENWNTEVSYSDWEELYSKDGYWYAFMNTTNGQRNGSIRVRINGNDDLIYFIDTVLPERYYHFNYAD